jgi:magnesium transporter
MNFKIMPELNWDFGYPFAILLMVLSVAITLGIFRSKKWI